jgi:hypothetical protein
MAKICRRLICRRLANDLRREHALGMEGIQVTADSGGWSNRVSRLELAISMDAQAARWEAEAKGGPRNRIDRARIGMP